MARKRGRPPKTPSSSSKKSPEKQDHCDDNHGGLDLSLSDEETLEAIDNLSPKKVVEMLKNLEVLKERIQKKVPPVGCSKEGVIACDETEKNQAKLMKEGIEATSGVLKQPSVWEKFDISKLRNAVDAVAKANVEGLQSCSEGTVVGDSVSSSDDISRGSTGANGAGHGADCQVADLDIPKEDSSWTTVITRSKAQIRYEQGKGAVDIHKASLANG
ncbi:hypothetical protein RIF29_02067 [Crotalaria pallida]|uniref:Uncharacterized protein n=1 Tax=Crotalaria pallida TaxID=3830 RepID=A0AAN9IYT5_CROPI